MTRKCAICKEPMPGAPDGVLAHPACERDHPEFKIELPVMRAQTYRQSASGDDEWLKQFEKDFGKGVLRKASEIEPIRYRGSGSIALDVALGGGWPRGRVIDVIGKEGSGKTVLCLLAAIVAAEEEGLRSILWDLEGTFDPALFAMLGGDLDMLDVITADNVKDRGAALLFGETAFDMARAVMKFSERHACLIFDSTGAMVSKAEYEAKEETMEKATMTHTARLMSDGLRVLVGSGLLARSGMDAFFISQSRDNVGARAVRGIPPPDKVTGGRALRFYASVRAEVSKGLTYKADVSDDITGRSEKDVEVGHATKVRIRKNKCNKFQGRVAEFDFYTEGETLGVDRVTELFRLATYTGTILKGGSWYEYTGISPFRVQGKDTVMPLLRDPKLYQEIYIATRTRLAEMMDATAQPETDEELQALEGDVDVEESNSNESEIIESA